MFPNSAIDAFITSLKQTDIHIIIMLLILFLQLLDIGVFLHSFSKQAQHMGIFFSAVKNPF